MIDKNWFYVSNGKAIGPFTTSKLEELFQAGILDQNTYVWYESLSTWKRSSEIPSLAHLSATEYPLLAPGDEKLPPLPRDDFAEPHPWPRYFARTVDMTLAAVMLGIVIGIVQEIFDIDVLNRVPDVIFGIFSSFCWIPFEAILLAAFGTTPGKWILHIKISSLDDAPVDFEKAFKRSFLVWFRGYGVGFPLITLATMISSYNTLKSSGKTSWDRELGLVTNHGRIGVVRVIFAVIVLASTAFLRIAGSLN